jgi:hypothetical protein
MFLTGNARLWWEDYCARNDPVNHSPCTTFAQFERTISAPSSLGAFDPGYDARETIHKLNQTTSVHEYTSRFRSAIRYLSDRSPADHLHYYIRGLKSHVKTIVLTHQPATLDEAITIAEQGDRASYLARHQNNRVTFVNHRPSATPMDLGTVTSNLHNISISPRTPYRYQGRQVPPLPFH